MDSTNLGISASPHVRSKTSTSDIMFDVILALVPASVFGIMLFGLHSALLILTCVVTCALCEFLFQRKMNKKVTITDFSAMLTGLLLALNLPPEFPLWMAVIGSVFAIIVVKQLFGGLGQNFMNPALGARCFLLLSFSRQMTNFVYDGVSTATPLTVLKAGQTVNVKDMFFGYTGGTIGETCTLALLIGGLYLLVKKVISPRIPLMYIGTFTICIAIYAITKDYDVLDYTLAHLCGGGLMLGAWFMATDYVTSPITPNGKLLYGVILGLLTFALRIFGGSAEGVSYAIIISNLLVPLIEKATVPKSFGEGAKPGQKDEMGFDTKSIVRAIVAIFAITIVLGGALGVVYNLTKKPIEDASLKAKQNAYKEVYQAADDIVAVDDESLYSALNEKLIDEGYKNVSIEEISIAKVSGADDGIIALVSNGNGYGGKMQLAIGVGMDGNIKGVAFLTLNETAGLGMEAKNDAFINQFKDKTVDKFSYTKTGATRDEEIDALSGATITTSAVVDSINVAIEAAKNMNGR